MYQRRYSLYVQQSFAFSEGKRFGTGWKSNFRIADHRAPSISLSAGRTIARIPRMLVWCAHVRAAIFGQRVQLPEESSGLFLKFFTQVCSGSTRNLSIQTVANVFCRNFWWILVWNLIGDFDIVTYVQANENQWDGSANSIATFAYIPSQHWYKQGTFEVNF